MALSRFEFVGIRKNGRPGTEIITAINLRLAQTEAKKKLKTITQTRHLTDVAETDELETPSQA